MAWETHRALREQWVHEDDLVHYRMIWLILSQGLLFTAYRGRFRSPTCAGWRSGCPASAWPSQR